MGQDRITYFIRLLSLYFLVKWAANHSIQWNSAGIEQQVSALTSRPLQGHSQFDFRRTRLRELGKKWQCIHFIFNGTQEM